MINYNLLYFIIAASTVLLLAQIPFKSLFLALTTEYEEEPTATDGPPPSPHFRKIAELSTKPPTEILTTSYMHLAYDKAEDKHINLIPLSDRNLVRYQGRVYLLQSLTKNEAVKLGLRSGTPLMPVLPVSSLNFEKIAYSVTEPKTAAPDSSTPTDEQAEATKEPKRATPTNTVTPSEGDQPETSQPTTTTTPQPSEGDTLKEDVFLSDQFVSKQDVRRFFEWHKPNGQTKVNLSDSDVRTHIKNEIKNTVIASDFWSEGRTAYDSTGITVSGRQTLSFNIAALQLIGVTKKAKGVCKVYNKVGKDYVQDGYLQASNTV